MNLNAITTIAELEIRQRMRSTRWKVTVAVLFLIVSAIVLGSLYLVVGFAGDTYRVWSRHLFDLSLGLVLFLGFAAAPTLSATSINGDRRDATLALVQATPISAWELTLGKLLGSWFSALALIGVALPYLIWGIAVSGVSVGFGVLAIVLTIVLLLAYCAVGLGFSAVTVRPAASAMLTQSTVLFLLVGLPITFGLTYPLIEQKHEVVVSKAVATQVDDTTGSYQYTCTLDREKRSFDHTERTWWLLAPNPVLIVADTVGAGSDLSRGDTASTSLAEMLSATRNGPDLSDASCAPFSLAQREVQRTADRQHIGQSWYIGLAITVLLGWAGAATAARRLRVPAHKLSRGVRVA